MSDRPELNESELLQLNIGIVPALQTFKENPFPLGTIKFKDDSELVYKHEHIDYYMNEIVMPRTLNLSSEDKDRYFRMITDYADILIKIVGDDNHVIWKAALGQPYKDLEKHANKSQAVIDYDKPKKLLQEYDIWRVANGLDPVSDM
jgi:hypothetical protein